MHSIHSALALVVALSAGSATLVAQSAPAQPTQPAGPAATKLATLATTSSSALTLAPFKRGDRIFNVDASGSLYVRNGSDEKPRLLLPAGSYAALAPSPDGKYIAYSVPAAAGDSVGSDVRVRSIETARDLPDVLHNATISRKPWTQNEKGFFYTSENPTDHRQRVYYHSLGKDQSRDGVIVSQGDQPDWRYDAQVSDDGHYAVFTVSHPMDAHTRLYFIDLDTPGKPKFDAPIVRLVNAFGARYNFIDNAGSYFFLKTERDAPRGSVVLANTDVTRASRWPTIIPQQPDSLLYVRTAGDQFVIGVYRVNGSNVARVFGPPDPAEMRAEFKQRIDSLRKERENRDNNHRDPSDAIAVMRVRDPSPIRLQRLADFPLPAGSSIAAVNTVADQEEVFYTVLMPDGSMRSFIYNIKDRRSQPFPTGPQTH